jgi:hypothetical protein
MGDPEPRLLSVEHLTTGFDLNRRFVPASSVNPEAASH